MKIYKVLAEYEGWGGIKETEEWYFSSLEKAEKKLKEILPGNDKRIREVFYGGNYIKTYEDRLSEKFFSLEEINVED